MEKCRHGCEKAFTMLHRRHDPLVLHVAGKHLSGKDYHERLEVSGKTWCIVCGKLNTWNEEAAAFSTWISGITIYVCRNHRRSDRRRQKHEQAAAWHQSLIEDDTPLHQALADERNAVVRQAIRSLNERDRQLLELKYIKNLSAREVARITGMEVSAVYAGCARAKEALKDALGPEYRPP